MKNVLIAAILSLAAACANDRPPPRDAAPADSPATSDSAVSVPADAGPSDASLSPQPADASAGDLSPPGDTGAPDAPAEGPAPDALAADLAAPDVASPDVAAPVDAAPDGGEAGGALCGNVAREMLCTTYCQGITSVCTGGNAQFATTDACRTMCSAPTWGCGAQGELTGNSLFCRLAHLAFAGVGAVAIECPNAGPGSPVCR
jgi:hypothetical protein